jgi:hypothetical protein
MALFTDGPIARLEDLRGYETAVLDLASGEGVDVGAKLRMAQREIATELTPFLMKNGLDTRDLSHVVVTDPIVEAHALRTLALIYRDLYQSRLNDRYEGKWREYARQSESAMHHLFEAGVGISTAPISKATPPVLGSMMAGLLPARTYYARVGWTSGSRLMTGSLSEAASIPLSPGAKVTVSAPSLPTGVTGWLLYLGVTADETFLQTDSPLTPGSIWTEPDGGYRMDIASWPVQSPDYYVENTRTILRG